MRRDDFPLLKKFPNLIYFDSGATSQKPLCVIDAQANFYKEHYGTVHRALYQLSRDATASYNAARVKLQKFINAKEAEEIVFTRGTTESINLVAASFGEAFIQEGDEILISEIEHHSNCVPWQMLCKKKGAHLKTIKVKESGELCLESYKEHLSSGKVKLVSVFHISNTIGTVSPVKEMVKLAHKQGAKFLLDAAQSASHLPLDVQELDVDFLAFSSHKMYGPTGCGILYGKMALLEKMPPQTFGGDMIEKVSLKGTSFARPPLRFEAGTPLIGEVIGLGMAIDYLQEVGLKSIATHEERLLKRAQERLLEIPGIKIYGNGAKLGPLVSFNIEGAHPLDVATLLDHKGVAIRSGHLCSQPTMERFGVQSMLRVTFGLYNELEEIDRFIDHLREVVCYLK